MNDSFSVYLEFAKQLATRAGEVMLQHFTIGTSNELKPDAGNSPVTIADTSINSLVIQSIKEQYPNHAVVGEEESHHVDDAPYTWVCDPIDGTIPYVMGMPTNVFSLALVNSDGQPVVAVVHDPYLKRTFWATKGGGAFLNNEPIRVNAIDQLSEAYTGMSGSRLKVVDPLKFKTAMIKSCFRPVVLNCTIYEAMMVAAGQMGATVYLSTHPHDVATSKLIVEEAGGKVTDIFGNEQRYDSEVNAAIISNGRIHNAIVDLAQANKP